MSYTATCALCASMFTGSKAECKARKCWQCLQLEKRTGAVAIVPDAEPTGIETVIVHQSPTPSRYRWTYQGVTFDFYRLCDILGITSHAQAHALKKVIRAGRGGKTLLQDIDESIDALRRFREMAEEDAPTEKP